MVVHSYGWFDSGNGQRWVLVDGLMTAMGGCGLLKEFLGRQLALVNGLVSAVHGRGWLQKILSNFLDISVWQWKVVDVLIDVVGYGEFLRDISGWQWVLADNVICVVDGCDSL